MKILVLAIVFFASSVFATPEEQKCIDNSKTIDQKLACLDGATFQDMTNYQTPKGARQFEIQFKQAVDHAKPEAGYFTQRLALLHKDENQPMVLQTSGYSIFSVRLTALATVFGTNQVQVEHRYFAKSRPEERDWSKLDIKQSADDFHGITSSLKQIYKKRWVNTGGSKGGMTSIYHRYFYPNDLDGTVADVAPLSFTTRDQRYNEFVDNVGGDTYKTCRENFKKMQMVLLENRDSLVPSITGSFKTLGSADLAFEHSVIESMFYFWQYGNPDDKNLGCGAIPIEGTFRDMFSFQQHIAPMDEYNDNSVEEFLPYYYQAATQLGSPDNVTAHLENLRRYLFNIDQYTPKNTSYSYSNKDMLDVDAWVRRSADKIIFVYGEFDPWSAGQFPATETGNAVYKYFVPKGNHGSNFMALPSKDKAQVVSTLSSWFDKTLVIEPVQVQGHTLEELEFNTRRKHLR